MALKNKTARPAARKSSRTSPASSKIKKTVAARSKREPIAQVVERANPRGGAPHELPKMKGELPVPVATFYF
jgi:hypothetical protein